MQIDLYCNKTNFCCNYDYWNKIRTDIIKATFIYLYIAFEINDSKEGSSEKRYIGIIRGIMNSIEKFTINDNYIQNLLLLCNEDVMNAFICFDVEGLLSICSKDGCQGFYSIGDSYAICKLFKLIKPFLLKNIEFEDSADNFVYKSVLELENIFQESVSTKTSITIC